MYSCSLTFLLVTVGEGFHPLKTEPRLKDFLSANLLRSLTSNSPVTYGHVCCVVFPIASTVSKQSMFLLRVTADTALLKVQKYEPLHSIYHIAPLLHSLPGREDSFPDWIAEHLSLLAHAYVWGEH